MEVVANDLNIETNYTLRQMIMSQAEQNNYHWRSHPIRLPHFLPKVSKVDAPGWEYFSREKGNSH
jgi:hypothetical protein